MFNWNLKGKVHQDVQRAIEELGIVVSALQEKLKSYTGLGGQISAPPLSKSDVIGLIGAYAQGVVGDTSSQDPLLTGLNTTGASVTSVGVAISGGAGLSVSGSPITSSGTISIVSTLDQVATKKSNLSAALAPGVGNDNTQGYTTGSIWVDTTGAQAYICITAGTGAANWKQIT